jgi:glycosyltransferase involved in cell wall biosynthesis
MRILIIPTTDFLRHPTPHRHHYLAEKLSKRHDVYVLHFDIFRGEQRWKTSASLVKTGPIRTQKLIPYYLLNAPFHSRTIKRILREKDIDVVWAAHLLPSILGFRAARRLRKTKKILSVYDFNDYFPEGAAMYYDNKTIKNLLYNWGTKLLHKNMRMADLVTAVSPPMYEYSKNNGANNVELLTNGVDTELFYPGMDVSGLKTELKINKPVVGFVASVERWFKLEEMLHAFRDISNEFPDVQFLVVGGSIKTTYYQELVDLVKKLKLNENTIMTGLVPYSQVPLYINLMDITVIPPIKDDAKMKEFYLPNKLFQYMACGKPILTPPFTEILKVADDAVIKFNNNDELCHKCVELLSSGAQTNSTGIEIAKKYDWETKAGELENLFERYLDMMA